MLNKVFGLLVCGNLNIYFLCYFLFVFFHLCKFGEIETNNF